jgi:hypothetical protein
LHESYIYYTLSNFPQINNWGQTVETNFTALTID